MNFIGAGKRLGRLDIPKVAARIGVGEDEIRAILDVETSGSGFDTKGRPRMLFEPHVFWRELGPGPARDEAEKLGLARPRWKRDYPRDSYPCLVKALAICDKYDFTAEPALRAASWGLPQIMGFNHFAAGYPTALAMVTDFMESEENQLNAMITFIIQKKLAGFLRARDWKGFAAGYNGKGFAANGYDRKLIAAFDKWQKIKDEIIEPAQPVKPRAGNNTVAWIAGVIAAAFAAWTAIVKDWFGG